jgi:hypothetical protein
MTIGTRLVRTEVAELSTKRRCRRLRITGLNSRNEQRSGLDWPDKNSSTAAVTTFMILRDRTGPMYEAR